MQGLLVLPVKVLATTSHRGKKGRPLWVVVLLGRAWLAKKIVKSLVGKGFFRIVAFMPWLYSVARIGLIAVSDFSRDQKCQNGILKIKDNELKKAIHYKTVL